MYLFDFFDDMFYLAKLLALRAGHSVAVIGDGAITGGMAWEAMNHVMDLRGHQSCHSCHWCHSCHSCHVAEAGGLGSKVAWAPNSKCGRTAMALNARALKLRWSFSMTTGKCLCCALGR